MGRSCKTAGLIRVFVLLLIASAWGCKPTTESGTGGEGGALSGRVTIDGSSTVYPITEAVAEEFGKEHPGVQVTVGISGSGGGFKKFVAGELDISDASRPIKDSEKEAAAAAGIEYIELEVAYDGLSVVVNKENDWLDCLTVEQLKTLWRDETVQKWSDLNPDWPDEKINLYGPGTDSGTFDYFTEAIMGESGASRPDFTASEDDSVLVTGVAADKYSLGYFGYAYFAENQDKLKLVAVDSGGGCVKPSDETVRANTYTPLSRPLFLYVRKSALSKPHVAEFLRYYLNESDQLISEVGYVPVSEEQQKTNSELLEEGITAAGAAK